MYAGARIGSPQQLGWEVETPWRIKASLLDVKGSRRALMIRQSNGAVPAAE
jgi:hypothetical protein